MKVEEIKFNEYAEIRKKCICFAKDGNTVVKPYRTMYSLAGITKDKEYDKLYIEVVEVNSRYTQYILWNDLGVICVKSGYLREELEMSQIIEMIKKYKYFGKEGFFQFLRDKQKFGEYINKVDIETCLLLGNKELAVSSAEHREKYIKKREEKEEKERLEREERRKSEEEERQKELDNKVNEAIEKIKNGRLLHNDIYDDNTSIVLFLFKKYNINIPLKTKGWINNALTAIGYKDGKVSYRYYKTSRDSTVFYGYLKELIEKIIKEN